MRRAIVPLALMLALVTGVVLQATRVVVLAPAVVPSLESRAQSNATLIQGFYNAVNETLATGETSGLDAVLDANFVDHTTPTGLPLASAEFVQSLLSLRLVAPSLQLDVRDLVVQSDRVAATVATNGGDEATFLGLPVSATTLWSATDLLRVDAGQIAERWGNPTGLASYTPLLSIDVPIEEPAGQLITLERWTYAPGATETRVGEGGIIVLLCESGSLAVQVSDADGPLESAGRQFASSPNPRHVVRPGEAALIPIEGRIDVLNDGTVPAVVLAVLAADPTPPNGSVMESVRPTTGIGREVLAAGSSRDVSFGGARIAIGRVVLAPGAGILPHSVELAELCAVETGALALSDGGRASIVSRPNAFPRRSHGGSIEAGGGAYVDAETVVAYHNAGVDPLILVMAIISPISADLATAFALPLRSRST